MPNLLPFTLISLIWTIPSIIAALPFVFLSEMGKAWTLVSIAAAPPLFIVTFPVIGGILSLFGQKGIVPGKFPREPFHPVYLLRRIYSACWTQLYYFKPIYSVVLAIPVFKKMILRLYGYRGSCDFVVYPDTWVRDLAVLQVESGAYLANRATIGTNMCLSDGTVLVDNVKIQKNAMVGHLAMLGPGVQLSEKSEIGAGAAIGIRVKVREGASIKPTCMVNHGAIIGKRAQIGTMSYIGMRAEIGDDVDVPAGANIPGGAIIKTQEEMSRYHSSETDRLNTHREMISEGLGPLPNHAR